MTQLSSGNKIKATMELLSPAGSFKHAIAAVKGGADAVYLGIEGVENARSWCCRDFSAKELRKLLSIARRKNIKIYATINSFYSSACIEKILPIVKRLESTGINGIIAGDIGLIQAIRQRLPRLKIIFSVQGECVNPEYALLLKELGVSRIILERDTSIDEAKNIKIQSGVEVEMFAFGYQCYSYNSTCCLSQYFMSKLCHVYCARKAQFVNPKEEKKVEPCEGATPHRPPIYRGPGARAKRFFFMKYSSALHHIPELIDSGIDSLKIEGRQRSAFYTYRVTKVFRQAIDHYKNCKLQEDRFKIKRQWQNELKKAAFNLEVTNGFFTRNNYQRKIAERISLRTKTLFLADCIREFLTTYNFNTLKRHILLGLKLNFYPYFLRKKTRTTANWDIE